MKTKKIDLDKFDDEFNKVGHMAGAKSKKPGLRKTFMVREVLRVDLMVDGEPYIASKVGGGKSYALNLADSTGGTFEDDLCNKLGLNKGDKIEFTMTIRKIERWPHGKL